MKLSSQMKNLSEGIISSFKQRIQENEELVIEVQKTLNGFRKDHQDMTAALRSGLDKGEKTRLKEFVALMKGINEKILEIFTYTDDLLAKSEEERLKEFVALMTSINEEISGIFTYTHDLLEKSEVKRLKEFAILIKSINEEVLRIFSYTHDMLAKGEVERLKEFNVVMKGIRNDVKNLKNAVAELLGDYAQDRGEASAAWKKMSDVLAQLRKTAVMPLEQVVRKAEKKEMKMGAPIAVQPKVEPKPAVPVTLEQKVLIFINNHPKGTKISDMEELLGENRMKLGFVAKTLLDQEEVQKFDNMYFPKK